MSSATRGVAVAVRAIVARAPTRWRGVGQGEVVGPEVVAPLRDAVRLVDHEQTHSTPARAFTNGGEPNRSGAT